MKKTQIKDLTHLKELLESREEALDFFIALNGGFRSSKRISYDADGFFIHHEIDDTMEEDIGDKAFMKSFTGKAMYAGALYMIDWED